MWSIATAATALATNFGTFILARTLVGVGEAAYTTISPSLLSDYYPPAQRSRVLAIFATAGPLGAAVGFSVGGAVGAAAGWRVAFLVAGIPGVALAFLCLLITEPPVGAMDGAGASAGGGAVRARTEPVESWRTTLKSLAANRHYRVVVGGTIAVTFAIGGSTYFLSAVPQACIITMTGSHHFVSNRSRSRSRSLSDCLIFPHTQWLIGCRPIYIARKIWD